MKNFHRDEDGRVTFGDGKEYARVVLDSVGPNGRRIVSVETRYWRAIHAEIMTHRDRARNAASSRAIPFYREKDGYRIPKCMYSMIMDDGFVPEFLGTEQRGMQSGGELEGAARQEAIDIIHEMKVFCVAKAKKLADLGLHKSICNRYVEPWMYITVLMTATEWANFFRLRVHPKAEKHFDKMARLVREAIRQSEPQHLAAGEWHTPYIRPGERDEVGGWSAAQLMANLTDMERIQFPDPVSGVLCKVSAGRSARLSYLTQDGVRDFEQDIRLFQDLIDPKIDADRDDDVIHASPLEHVNQARTDADYRSGPFVGWHQLRKNYPRENVEGMGRLDG